MVAAAASSRTPPTPVPRAGRAPVAGGGPGATASAWTRAPAARRMAPATPEPSQPSLLAALTIPSVPAAVMSPCQTQTPVAPQLPTLRRSSMFPPVARPTVPRRAHGEEHRAVLAVDGVEPEVGQGLDGEVAVQRLAPDGPQEHRLLGPGGRGGGGGLGGDRAGHAPAGGGLDGW